MTTSSPDSPTTIVVRTSEHADAIVSSLRTAVPAALVTAGAPADQDADLVLTPDPDGTHLGVEARHEGSLVALTPDEVSALVLAWLAQTTQDTGRSVVVATVAHTDTLDWLADRSGLALRRTLTGSDEVARQAAKIANDAHDKLLLAVDEDGAMTCDGHAPAAPASAVLIARMAVWHKGRGCDLVDALHDLRASVGYALSGRTEVPFASDMEMAELMMRLRRDAPELICSIPVEDTVDFLPCIEMPGDPTQRLPFADALCFNLIDGSKIVLRADEDRTAIVAYCLSRGDSEAEARAVRDALVAEVPKVLFEKPQAEEDD